MCTPPPRQRRASRVVELLRASRDPVAGDAHNASTGSAARCFANVGDCLPPTNREPPTSYF